AGRQIKGSGLHYTARRGFPLPENRRVLQNRLAGIRKNRSRFFKTAQLRLASGVELLADDAKPPVRRRTDSGKCRNDRVAASAGGRCVLRAERFNTNLLRCFGPTRVTKMLSLRERHRRDAPKTCPSAR